VTAEQVAAIVRRAFGAGAEVSSAVELGSGMYNTTFRVEVVGQGRPVILRVAPAPARQFASERELMRNEYASLPYLGVIAPLLPRVIVADWSHELIGRDWMLATFLDGVPGPEALGRYPRSAWPGFFRQMGTIAAAVHAVPGPWFGPVAGPGYSTWGQAVLSCLEMIVADLEGVGLDATDLRKVTAAVAANVAVLDAVTRPRMTLGDFWTLNTMLDPTAPQPTITGVFDTDRTWWADPAWDWTIRMALAKADERTAFWDGYGRLDSGPDARWRQRVYEARHLGAVRLERARLGGDVQATYGSMADVLADLS
jgi:aminoglycoside phosphotransferase (APT) family kinase protein